MNGRAVYFDQAATSWPKPPAVIQAVNQALIQFGGNPGHGGHRMAMRAAQQVFRTREEAAQFFGAEPENVIFTASCTHALNMALKGLWKSEEVTCWLPCMTTMLPCVQLPHLR